jgi:hypothetical protein
VKRLGFSVLLLLAACEDGPTFLDHDASIDLDASTRADASTHDGSSASDASACASPKVSADGLCSDPPPSTACGTNPFGADGCGMDAVCLANVDVDGTVIPERRCYSFGPCPPSGMCPIGTNGAVCNGTGMTALLKDKGDICVATLCLTTAHCPSGQGCVQGHEGYGYCSDGKPGSVCSSPADCASGMCMQIAAGILGNCI